MGEVCEILVNFALVSSNVFTSISYALKNALVVMASEGYLAITVLRGGFCFFVGGFFGPNTQFGQ